MQMDARLILAGQPVNALAALDAGTQAAGRAGMVGQQGDLLSLYRQQGPGIAAGDPTALNALASLDPMASLGVQESRLGMDATRQSMRINEEQLGLARAAGARAAEAHAASMSAAERQRQAAETRAALTTVLPALRQAEQTGDLTTINQMLRTYGMEPVGSVEEAYVRYMQVEGAVETLETFRGLTAGPEPDYMTLNDQLVDRNAPGGPAVVPVQGLQAGGDDLGAEDSLRTEFSDDRVVREFQQQAPAFRRIQAAAADPSAAGDMAMIFNFMKLLDPGSTVREGEFATAQNAGGVDSRIISLYNSVINGTRLAPEQRRDFLDRAERLYFSAEDGFNQVRQQYEDLAERRGINTDGLLIDYRVPRGQTRGTGQPVTFAPPPGIQPPPSGVQSEASETPTRGRNAGGVTSAEGMDFSQVSNAELAAMPAPNREEDPEGYAAYLQELRRRAMELTNGGR